MKNIFVIHDLHNRQRELSLIQEMAYSGLFNGTHYDIIAAEMYRGKACTGISRSHKKCVRLAKELKLPYVIIIEDDIMFLDKTAMSKFQQYREKLPADWEIFLGGMYDGVPHPINENVATVMNKISGLHLYMVHEGFYDKFLMADEAANLDWWLSTQAKANIYVAYPMLALQHEFYSANAKKILNYNYGIDRKYKLINNPLK